MIEGEREEREREREKERERKANIEQENAGPEEEPEGSFGCNLHEGSLIDGSSGSRSRAGGSKRKKVPAENE